MNETAARATDVDLRAGSVERGWLAWVPIALGLLILYVPTYVELAQTYTGTESGAEQPIFLIVCAWLVWKGRAALLAEAPESRATLVGVALIGLAAPMYILGRSQQFYQLEVGSQLPLSFGILALVCGFGATRRLWFALAFQIFLVPIPGSFLERVLLPLKETVSDLVMNLLFFFGVPIARQGVVISVGPYQLLVANACSGLNSMIALTAVGLLYVHRSGYLNWRRNAILLASVLPIAFLANILRVTGLVLATYLCGDSFGRYFHAFAAYAEIIAAFGAFFALDALLDRLVPRTAAVPPAAAR